MDLYAVRIVDWGPDYGDSAAYNITITCVPAKAYTCGVTRKGG